MDAAAFLGLEPTEDPTTFRLPVTNGICTGGRFLFGGAGLAAGVVALEKASGRPLVWATAQYLSFARPPTSSTSTSRSRWSATRSRRAASSCRDDGQEIITVQRRARNPRPLDIAGQWAERPDVPPPDDCRDREFRNDPNATISSRIEERVAMGRSPREMDGTPGDGRAALWARMPELLEMSPAALAVLGDFVPFGVSQATGRMAGGNSLDNTLARRRRSCRRSGCCSTFASTPSRTASPTASCTCGPRTARFWPPRASGSR